MGQKSPARCYTLSINAYLLIIYITSVNTRYKVHCNCRQNIIADKIVGHFENFTLLFLNYEIVRFRIYIRVESKKFRMKSMPSYF